MVSFSCWINKTLLIAFVNATFSEEPCLLINDPYLKRRLLMKKMMKMVSLLLLVTLLFIGCEQSGTKQPETQQPGASTGGATNPEDPNKTVFNSLLDIYPDNI